MNRVGARSGDICYGNPVWANIPSLGACHLLNLWNIYLSMFRRRLDSYEHWVMFREINKKLLNLLYLYYLSPKPFNFVNLILNLLKICQYSLFIQFWLEITDMNTDHHMWHGGIDVDNFCYFVNFLIFIFIYIYIYFVFHSSSINHLALAMAGQRQWPVRSNFAELGEDEPNLVVVNHRPLLRLGDRWRKNEMKEK